MVVQLVHGAYFRLVIHGVLLLQLQQILYHLTVELPVSLLTLAHNA